MSAKEDLLKLDPPQKGGELELLRHLYEFDPTQEYAEADRLLFCGEDVFLPVGDITVVSGKAKHGKSSVVAILVASILGCNTFFTPNLDDASVIWFDTEQSPEDVQAQYRKVCEMLKRQSNVLYPDFRMFSYRKAEKMKEDGTSEALTCEDIYRCVVTTIELLKPDVVVLDGCTDLIHSINSEEESTKLVRDLLMLCSKYNLAMITIVHENQGKDTTDPRGHIGKELVRKCACQLRVVKNNTDKSNVYFVVTNEECRHKPIPDWSFKLSDNKIPIPYDTPTDEQMQEERRKQKAEEQRPVFEAIFKSGTPMSHKELKVAYMEKCNVSERTATRKIGEMTGTLISKNSGAYTLMSCHETE